MILVIEGGVPAPLNFLYVLKLLEKGNSLKRICLPEH